MKITWKEKWISKRKKRELETKRLTERIPHPVGIKAKMEANTSATDKSESLIATTKPASANNKETPWMKRNRSWKLTDIFWLKVNTCETKAKEY